MYTSLLAQVNTVWPLSDSLISFVCNSLILVLKSARKCFDNTMAM